METEPRKQEKWKTKTEFLVACLSYTIGFDNIWRFPYLCYISGGIAFAIPYCIILLLCGFPLLYMELAVGQCVGCGPAESIGRMVPLLKGTGIAMVIMVFIVCSYYSVILAWALHYFFSSFKSILPWTQCPANITECWDSNNPYNASDIHQSYVRIDSASQYYFQNEVLRISSGIDDMGSINGPMLGYLFLAWIVCLLCLIKGVRIIGKVSYVLVALIYIILFVLFCRTITLSGAYQGIRYYAYPDLDMLKSERVWLSAYAHAFHSVGIGMGTIMTYSSYNRKTNNILADALLLTYVNTLTSVCTGFIVFGALGHLAYSMGVEMHQVTVAGLELAFVSISNTLSKLYLPQLWSALFFLVLFLVGLGTVLGMVEVVITSVKDWLSEYPSRAYLQKWIPAVVCGVCFVAGIPNVMEGGIYYLTLLDMFTAIIAFLFIVAFEIIAFCYIFGANKLFLMIEAVAKQRPPYALLICWKYISLYIMLAILGYGLYSHQYELVYSSYVFPFWANFIGWMLMIFIIACIPGYAFYRLFFWQLRSILTPFREIFIDSVSPKLGYLFKNSSLDPNYPIQPQAINSQTDTVQPTTSYEGTKLEEAQIAPPPPEYEEVVGTSNL